MAIDMTARAYATAEAIKYAMQYGSIGLKDVTANATNDGLLFTFVDDTTHDVPLTTLDFLWEKDLSSSLTSESETTPANCKAIKLTNDKFEDYILKTSITDSLVGTDSTLVASSKAVGDLNTAKIDKTDIQTTIINNPTKPAGANTVYDVKNDLTTNYIPNTKKSNSITSESTTDVATSKAIFDTIDYLETNMMSKADLTDDYNGQSTTLALSQKGGYNLKNLISSAVSGLTYIGLISATNFKTMTVWKQGDMYKASELIEVGTQSISKNSLIIMKTSSIEGGTDVVTVDDFDSFMSDMEFSHTALEIDTATNMTLDAQFTKLGWVDIASSKLYINEASRTISVGFNTGYTSSHLYINGSRLIMDTPAEITFPENSTTFYVIMSEAKALSIVNTIDYNDYASMPICFVRWNNVNQTLSAMFDLRVHNLLMDVPTRSYIYSNGIQWQKGFEISNFASTTADPDDLCRFDIAGGQIRQSEKLLTYTDSDTPTEEYANVLSPFTSKMYYISGSSYTQSDQRTAPLKMGTTYPQYNKNTDDTWSLAEPTEGQYVPMIVGVSTDVRASASAITIMGQQAYDSLDDCVNETKLNTAMLADLETRNFRFLYIVIYHCSTTYSNNYHAKAVKYLDIRTASMIPVVNGNSSSSSGTSLTKTDITTAEFLTAKPNTQYYLKTGSVGAEITLPNTGLKVQDKILVTDVDGILSQTTTVAINGTNATINSSANTFTLNVPYTTTEFEWSGATWIANLSGTLTQPIYTSKLTLPSSTTSTASMNIPIGGSAPTSPEDGDIFTDGNELYWKRSGFYFNQPLSTPTGTKTKRLSLSPTVEGFPFFQTDGIVGLYRWSLLTSWVYEGSSEWTSYTPEIGVYSGTVPTLASGSYIKGAYQVSGKTLKIKVSIYTGGNTGTIGSGVYTISIPSSLGYTINNTIANIPSIILSVANNSAGSDGFSLGEVSWCSNGSNIFTLAKAVPLNNSKVGIYMMNTNGADNGSTLWGSGFSYLNTAGFTMSFTAEIPILSV